MASDERYLRADLKTIVDEVVALRNAYANLRNQTAVQERSLAREKDKSLKLRSRLRTAINALLALKQRFKTAWSKAQEEKKKVTENVNELRRECDQLRSLVADRNSEDQSECISRLEGDVTALRTQLECQKEKRGSELTLNRQQKIDNEKLPKRHTGRSTIKVDKVNSSTRQGRQRRTKKLPLSDLSIVSAPRVDVAKTRKHIPYFRWPSLNVTITGVNGDRETNDDADRADSIDTSDNTGTERKYAVGMKSTNKKRKLYTDDKDNAVDVW